MRIYFHQAECSVYGADIHDICTLLHIPRTEFKSYCTANGAVSYSYVMPGSGVKESVFIRIPGKASSSGRITLHGSYFDWNPNFPMNELRDYVSYHGGNIYNIDISYQYDEINNHIDDYMEMSLAANYKACLKGSCTISRKKAPGDKADANNCGGMPRVEVNQRLIHFGDKSGNCVRLYQRKGYPAKFELTLRDKVYIKLLLEKYSPEKIAEFEYKAKEALVKHIDFVTPESKKAHRPTVRVGIYSQFLGSDVQPITWSKHLPTTDLATDSFDSGLTRALAQLQNVCRRGGILAELEKDIWRLGTKARLQFNSIKEAGLDLINLDGIDFNSATATPIV